MCIMVWLPNGREVGTQRVFAKLVGLSVKRLPLWSSRSGVASYTERSLVGRCCLCPVDVGKAMTDAGMRWHREDNGDYIVDRFKAK